MGLDGIVSFLGPIDCATTEMLRISKDTLIESQGPIIMNNVHVLVESGAQLGLISKEAIRLMRDEGSEDTILTIHGSIFYNVGGADVSVDNKRVPAQGVPASKIITVLASACLVSDDATFYAGRNSFNVVAAHDVLVSDELQGFSESDETDILQPLPHDFDRVNGDGDASYTDPTSGGTQGGLVTVIRSCDDLMLRVKDKEIIGTLSFVAPIVCTTPQTLPISGKVIITSDDHLVTRNVHVVVGSGAELALFAKKAIRLLRDEDSDEPLMTVGGYLFLKAGGTIPKSDEDAQEFQGSTVVVSNGGSLFSEDNPISAERDAVNFLADVPPRFVEKNMITTLPHDEDGADADACADPANSQPNLDTLQDDGVEDDDDPASSHVDPDMPGVPRDSVVANEDSLSVDTPNAPDNERMTEPPISEEMYPAESPSLERFDLDAEPIYASSLKVGETVQTRLVSVDGRTAIWPSVDGSILFSTVAGQLQEDAQESAILVDSAGRKRRKVEAIRSFLREEREREKRVGPGEDSSSGKGGKNIARGWFIRNPRRRREKDIDTARAHQGEVAMTLDDRGCVEVTVDGLCVLSKSGKYTWEWLNTFPWKRRRSRDYEVSASSDGMVVKRDGNVIWGVKVKEKKTRAWRVTAEDIFD